MMQCPYCQRLACVCEPTRPVAPVLRLAEPTDDPLPGHSGATNVLRRLPPSSFMTPEQALEDALMDARSGNLTDVMIVGYDAEGDLVVRSSRLNCAQAAFLALKAQRWAESGGRG